MIESDIESDATDHDRYRCRGRGRDESPSRTNPAIGRCARRSATLRDDPNANYKVFTTRPRRGDRRRGSVRRRGAGAAALLSRSAIEAAAERGRAAGQPPAAALAGQAEPRLELRSGRGRARHRAADARDHRSDVGAVVQAGRGHAVQGYGGHVAAGQFRLDARAPDHGGGALRRYSGAHAWSAAA